MKTQKRGRQDCGFTMVELLVVIGIIAILLGLIFASLSSAKAASTKRACANVLKSYGHALTLFTTDAGVYPLTSNVDTEKYPDHGRTWYLSLLGALGLDAHTSSRAGMWYCPGIGDDGSARISRASGTSQAFINYGYNGFGIMGEGGMVPLGLGGRGEIGFGPPVKVEEVANPAGMIAVGDGFVGGKDQIMDGAHIVGIQYSWETAFEDGTQRAMRRHGGDFNVVFADGHVEGVDLKGIYIDEEPALLQRLNRDGAPHLDRVER